MLRLLFSSKPKRVQHQLDAGELCMALPLAPLRAAGEQDKYFLATVVDYGKKKVVFFDDGSEMKIAVDAIAVASAADRDAAKFIYAAALDECKQLAAKDSEDIVAEAIEKVRAQMGGTLGGDGMISYTHSAGIEAKEGQLLLEALLANLGALAKQAPALRWMRSHWQEVCEQHDADKSGTISESEASGLWAQMTMTISSVIASKLDVLGTPPRLYRGDLCLATPEVASSAACSSAARSSAASRPAAAPELATYVDSTHVIFFDDSSDKVVGASSIQPATAAPKEQAILRYTMAVSQIKAIARKPSKAVVKDAIDKVPSPRISPDAPPLPFHATFAELRRPSAPMSSRCASRWAGRWARTRRSTTRRTPARRQRRGRRVISHISPCLPMPPHTSPSSTAFADLRRAPLPRPSCSAPRCSRTSAPSRSRAAPPPPSPPTGRWLASRRTKTRAARSRCARRWPSGTGCLSR